MNYKVGEIIYKKEPITINEGRPVTEMIVTNMGDRSIQVCSHYHFFESNLALKFNRPGEEKKISLVPYAGGQRLVGFMGVTMGVVTDPDVKAKALKKMKELEGGK
ncbi:MAG: urease subunit beta [Anaerovorax sp.]